MLDIHEDKRSTSSRGANLPVIRTNSVNSKPVTPKVMRKMWWRQPTVQAIWGAKVEHRHETWFELFYDLVIVACALQLGHIIPEHLDVYGIFYCFTIFFAIQSTWQGFVTYCNRFHTDDLTHVLFYGCQTLGVFLMACHLKPNEQDSDIHLLQWGVGFILVFVTTRVVFSLMYLQIAIFTDSYYYRYVGSNLIMGAMWLATVWTTKSEVWTLVLWSSSFAVYNLWLYGPSISRDKRVRVPHPLHLPHFTARMGILVMILLGESIIQLISTTRPSSSGGWYYSTIGMGFLLVFGLALQYFDSQPHSISKHAMRLDRTRAVLWITLHPFMAFSALLVGSGISNLFVRLDTLQHTGQYERLMCFATGSYLFWCFAIRMSHKGSLFAGSGLTSGRFRAYTVRILVAIGCFIVPYIHKDKPVGTICYLLGLVVILTILDVIVSKTEKHSHDGHGPDFHGGPEDSSSDEEAQQ